MLPTPSTSHVDVECIYEPAEDSYLLLDTFSSPSETQFLTQRFGPQAKNPSPVILEVGVGSGVVLAFVTAQAKAIFGRSDIIALGTDINELACRAAKQTVLQASQETNISSHTAAPASLSTTLCADLISPLRSGVADVLIFNPPYVPSPDAPGNRPVDFADIALSHVGDAKSAAEPFERNSHLLSLSYAGGLEGMEVISRLLSELPAVLNNKRGVAYILLCQQNRPDEVMRRIGGWGGGWKVDVVGRSGMKAGWEKLVVIRIWRI